MSAHQNNTTHHTNQLPAAPAYGARTLAEILPAIATRCGISEASGVATQPHDVFGLPQARGYVVLLVDGLGWNLLRRHLPMLGYIPELLADARAISAPVPSTTAVSLTTLGTGMPPAHHGIMGYTFRAGGPGAGLLNVLQWDEADPSPEQLQTQPSWLAQMADAGIAVSSVGRARFQDSGLTRAGLRGGHYRGIPDHAGASERIEQVVEATKTQGPCFVYLYEGDLDHTGHSLGVDSPQWRSILQRIDADLEQLREALPADICVMVTGDHGMIDVPKQSQIIAEDIPGLCDDLDLLGGEGRFRQLYTSSARHVADRWARAMGERAWVCTREEALEAGWFGPDPDPALTTRIGDVLVAMRGDYAVMTRTKPKEMGLVGQHGSLTDDEMQVPLLIDEGWAG